MSEPLAYPDGMPLWIECDMCEDFWCTLHDAHVWECPCPEIDMFAEFDVCPYTTSKSDPKVLLAIASQSGTR